MVVASVTCMLLTLVLGLVGLFPTLLDDFDVVVKDGSDDRDHIGLDDAGAHVFGSPNTDIDDTLEGQVPLPHVHHVFAASPFQDADKSLDAAIDGKNIPDPGGGGSEVCEMVKGIDERQGGGAVESPAIVKGGSDAHRRLVDVGDAKVDFPHDGQWYLAGSKMGRDG